MPAKINRQSIFPILMVVTGLILILGAALWFVASSRATDTRAADLPAPVTSPRIPYPQTPRISPADAKAAYELKSAVFIDTRGEPYYSSGHIPGAISLTEEELPSRLQELDPQAWIITYCT